MKICAWPRLHCGLLDLGRATSRAYGGAGIAIRGFPVELVAQWTPEFQVENWNDLSAGVQQSISLAIDRLRGLVEQPIGGAVRVVHVPPRHVGLGSGTVTTLALLKLLDAINELGLQEDVLKRISGRGGASGVGINVFFLGGFVADAGHAQATVQELVPSSAANPQSVPPLVCHARIPENWCFHLILPNGNRTAGRGEVNFFRRNTPVGKGEVYQSIAVMYHGVATAFRIQDRKLLRESLDHLHQVGFKARELNGQTDQVRQAYRLLRMRVDAPVGLSSLGPLLYAVGEECDQEERDLVARVAEELDAEYLGVYMGTNHGFEIVE